MTLPRGWAEEGGVLVRTVGTEPEPDSDDLTERIFEAQKVAEKRKRGFLARGFTHAPNSPQGKDRNKPCWCGSGRKAKSCRGVGAP